MKKRLGVCLVLFLLFAFAAQAEGVPGLSDSLFDQAKEALTRLSYGDYGSISAQLSWAGTAPSDGDWEALAGQFGTLNNGTVQRDVSVAYWWDNGWHIAVPVTAPNSDRTEALVLTSADGQRFDGYAFARWGSVKSAYESSEHVSWNEEYVESTPIIVGGD